MSDDAVFRGRFDSLSYCCNLEREYCYKHVYTRMLHLGVTDTTCSESEILDRNIVSRTS